MFYGLESDHTSLLWLHPSGLKCFDLFCESCVCFAAVKGSVCKRCYLQMAKFVLSVSKLSAILTVFASCIVTLGTRTQLSVPGDSPIHRKTGIGRCSAANSLRNLPDQETDPKLQLQR